MDGGPTPAELLTLAERALKVSVIRAEPIEFGEPQLIDNVFVLRASNDDGFREALRNAPVAFCMRRKSPRRLLTPKSALRARLQSDWYSSAWRDDRAALAESISANSLRRHATTYDGELLHGLYNLDDIVRKVPRHRRREAMSPRYQLSELLTTTIGRLKNKRVRQQNDPRYYAGAACRQAARRLQVAIKVLRRQGLHNNRSALLRSVVDSTNPLRLPDELSEWIAQTAIHLAYNFTLGLSWNSSSMWASEYFTYFGDDAVAYLTEYLDLLCPTLHGSRWETLTAGNTSSSGESETLWRSQARVDLDDVAWKDIASLMQDAHYQQLARRRRHEPSPDRHRDQTCELWEYASDCLAGLTCSIHRPRNASGITVAVSAGLGGGIVAGLADFVPPELLPAWLNARVLQAGTGFIGNCLGAGVPLSINHVRQTMFKRRRKTVVSEIRGSILRDLGIGRTIRYGRKK
jgi:hypothetical protein